jgi:acyl carrier protein
MTDTVDDEIRRIVGTHGRLAVQVERLSAHDDLYRYGMASHAAVNVMLAIEETFDIEFPETMLRRTTFQSLEAIGTAVSALVAAQLTA